MKKIFIIPLIIIFLSGCSNSSNTNINTQEKCANQSKIFFDNYENGNDTVQRDNSWERSYENHYNIKLDKCYILIHGFGDVWESHSLWDVFENKNMIQCETSTGEPKMNFCFYSGQNGEYNYEKFANFTKDYMQN